MRIINTKVHGVLDYLMSVVLIASPWIFGFANGTLAQHVPMVLGAIMLLMSICTNYELGLVKALSMRMHLTADFVSGLLLAVSPWLFDFYEEVYLPHLILGLAEIGASLMTEQTPYTHTTTHGHSKHLGTSH
ncbi:MAG: hypothetical protein K0S12_410 [Bacteroidetes bacterium]|jgi:hypothetical protein|nr:hypothetical protein [Bacteroidota bacterium]